MSPLGRIVERKAKTVLWKTLGVLISGSKKPLEVPVDFHSIRSALVVRPDRLGDVVLSTPVYASLKQAMPWVRITALVDRSNAEILAENPNVDEVLALEPNRVLHTLKELRRKSFDLALTLNKKFSARATLFTLCSQARLRVGYYHPENHWVHDVQVPVTAEPRHEIQNNLELLNALGINELSEEPQIFFNEEETRKITSLMGELRQFPDRPLVLIKPGTRVPEWGWRLEQFGTVTKELLQSQQVEVLFICAPGEESMLDSLCRPLDPRPRLLPVLSIRELALAIQQADLLFCNHTGIMHLASAVQTPLVVIFKHGEIARWGPWKTPHTVLEERAGSTLSPETVLQSIRSLLERKIPASN